MIYNTSKPLYSSLSFFSKIIFIALLIFSTTKVTKLRAQGSNYPSYECTQVIGFSQVGQPGSKDQPGPGYGWYVAGGVFESLVDDDRWQLLWEGGAAVHRWANPDYEGWNQKIISPCTNNSDTPDRILLSVSALFGKNVNKWAAAIEKAIETIQQKLPNVDKIILQPVVGGPGGKTCPCTRNCDFDWPQVSESFENIRASWQQNYIGEAIERVVAHQKQEVAVKGYYPQVESCTHYIDGLGHLTKQGAEYIGEQLGNYYK